MPPVIAATPDTAVNAFSIAVESFMPEAKNCDATTAASSKPYAVPSTALFAAFMIESSCCPASATSPIRPLS